MAKVINKTKGFGSIPRDLVYDNELSDRARFLYIYMACKPEEWEFYQDNMTNELGYSKDTLRKYMNELVERGWIKEEGQQNNRGKFGANVYSIEVTIGDLENVPCRKNTDTVKTRDGNNHKHINIDNKEIYNKEEINNKNNTKQLNDFSFEKKEKETISDLFIEENPEYQFNKWFTENFPTLAKNQRPLKYKTYVMLQSKYTKDKIILKLNAMEAKLNFNKEYSDVGRTLWNWLARDYDDNKKK